MALEHVAGKNKGRIVLYALSTCPWCRKVKGLLNERGIEYYFSDVDLLSGQEKEEAVKVVKKWNPNASFPTLIIDDKKVIVGFQEDKIKGELDK